MLALFPLLVLTPNPARADDDWYRVEVTCAGIQGRMRDGNWTYAGAAAQAYGLPYPWGTVIELQDGSQWTVEDSMAHWVSRWTGWGEHLDLYLGGDWATCQRFGSQRTSAHVIRWGWGE